MRLKTILLGATLAGVTLIASPNLVQAQEVCFRSEVVPPYSSSFYDCAAPKLLLSSDAIASAMSKLLGRSQAYKYATLDSKITPDKITSLRVPYLWFP
jgi:hypothetical protein